VWAAEKLVRELSIERKVWKLVSGEVVCTSLVLRRYARDETGLRDKEDRVVVSS